MHLSVKLIHDISECFYWQILGKLENVFWKVKTTINCRVICHDQRRRSSEIRAEVQKNPHIASSFKYSWLCLANEFENIITKNTKVGQLCFIKKTEINCKLTGPNQPHLAGYYIHQWRLLLPRKIRRILSLNPTRYHYPLNPQ